MGRPFPKDPFMAAEMKPEVFVTGGKSSQILCISDQPFFHLPDVFQTTFQDVRIRLKVGIIFQHAIEQMG
jgi:hypothetical protein